MIQTPLLYRWKHIAVFSMFIESMQTKAQKNGNGKMKQTRKLIPIGNTSENSPSKKKMYLVLPPMRKML